MPTQREVETPAADQPFGLQEIARGVYAALGLPGGGSYSNAGIVDLGDRCLIFDAFETPQAAAELHAAALRLTGHPVVCVIVSHAHSDHWYGTGAFDSEVTIVSTTLTRQKMLAALEELKTLQLDPSELLAGVRAAQQRLETETDPRWRKTLQVQIARMQPFLAALPALAPRIPNVTFGHGLVFHGPDRTVELLTRGPGHTESDAYLVLPQDRVAFMGDLGFFQSQPFMGDCSPQAWGAQLAELEGSEFEALVPGHGPPGTKIDVALQRQYIGTLEAMVAETIEQGGTVEDIIDRSLTPPFDGWLHGGMRRFEANVRASYRRQSAGVDH